MVLILHKKISGKSNFPLKYCPQLKLLIIHVKKQRKNTNWREQYKNHNLEIQNNITYS